MFACSSRRCQVMLLSRTRIVLVVLIQACLQGFHREICIFHLCSWKLWFQDEKQRERVRQKALKLLNFPFIKARIQTRTRWPLPPSSSHLKRWPTHKNMRLLWGMCIKLHFSQCKEAQQGLWGALRTSLHWLQWDTHLPKPRLRIRHSTPSPERCLVHLFVPTWNCQDLKLPLW